MPQPALIIALGAGRQACLHPSGTTFDPTTNTWAAGKTSPNLDLLDYAFTAPGSRCVQQIDCSASAGGKRHWLLSRGLLGLISPADLATILAAHDVWKASILAQASAVAAESKFLRGLLTRHLQQKAHEGERWDCEPSELINVFHERDLPADTLVSWDRSELPRAAILDLDFHDSGVAKPSVEIVEELARDLSPAPACWWLTQGGGMHALYLAGEHCSAEELAAGALAQLSIDPQVVYFHGTIEVKAGTRHPGVLQKGLPCGPLHECIPTEDFACLARLTPAGVSESELSAFLAKQGWTMGQSLPHDQCIIDPDHKSSSATPVFVGENGLFCHSCQARLGAGLRPWLSVLAHHNAVSPGEERLNCIAQAAANFVSWAHSSYLFASLMPQIQPPIRRLLYRALVKKTHTADDPRIPMVFDDEWAFARGETEWLHASTLQPARGLGRPDMLALPSCLDVTTDEEGEVKLVPRKAALASHVSDGPLRGFRPLAPHPFVPIFWQHNRTLEVTASSTGEAVGYMPLYCRPDVGAEGRGVSYREPSARIPLAEAEARISARWPGVNLTYCRAIIVALGHGESGFGRVPILWANGPTGSAKTTTLRLIASMLGEEIVNLSNADEDRLDQLYSEALDMTRFIVFDDFAKDEDKHAALNTFFLRVNRSHSAHRLYKGLSHKRVRAPIFLTDWSTPEAFVADRQFARRANMIQLTDTVQGWDEKAPMEGWWRESEDMREATESWFSYVVDDFFAADRVIPWPEAMRRLDIPLVSEHHNTESSVSGVRNLVIHLAYEIIQASKAPDILDPQLAQVVFKGAILAKPGAMQPVGQLVQRLLDTRGNPKWHAYNVQRFFDDHAGALQAALGLKCPAKIDAKMNGSQMYLRVVEVCKGRHSKRFNAGLCDERHWPLTPERVRAFTHPSIEDLPPDDHAGPAPATQTTPVDTATPVATDAPVEPLAKLPKTLRDLVARRRAAKAAANPPPAA